MKTREEYAVAQYTRGRDVLLQLSRAGAQMARRMIPILVFTDWPLPVLRRAEVVRAYDLRRAFVYSGFC